jgi:AAA+ superfamily predicted ATPase
MSSNDVERGLLARYLARVLGRNDLPGRAMRQILWWLAERADGFTLPLPAPIATMLANRYAAEYRPLALEQLCIKHRKEIVDGLEAVAAPTARPEPIAGNAETLVLALDIAHPDAAWKIIGLLACGARFEQIGYLANTVLDITGPIHRAISILIDEPPALVDALLAPSSDLITSGLVQIRDGEGVCGHSSRYHIPFRINSRLDRTYASFHEMRSALIGDPLVSAVGPADYEHVAGDRDLIVAVLSGAARTAASGVNILLYGPPGSGKTELAKVASAAAGLTLYATGEAAAGERESDRGARLADLVFASRLLAGQPNIALMLDEMEDVAVHLIQRGGSKVYLNRLLETNPLPILWTSNDLSAIDPSVLRRMTLAIELKRPPASQRKRIIQSLLARADLALSDVEADRLARNLEATPAILENAIRAARFAGGGAETIERAARGIMRAVSGMAARKQSVIPAFDPELTKASQDLLALADRLVGGQARAFSLCLSGPPGTGKSSFARYLAGRLGLEILQKRASDILGPYVGQTERAIADAFEEAREAGAFLVFDEADSLLLDRRDAQRSWEISQVNEMLTWMEEHALPVAFTTNLMERLDAASLRRFTFHVRFEHLDRLALARAWRVFFGLESPPSAGLGWSNLTPGDFAKARKQAEMLGTLGDPARLVDIMDGISRGKPEAGGTLGFVT